MSEPACHLAQALEMLAPFVDDQERARDTENLVALADDFRTFLTKVAESPNVSDLRNDFLALRTDAEKILSRLNRMTVLQRSLLESEISSDCLWRADRRRLLDLDSLRQNLAALSAFADRIREDRASNGGNTNFVEKLHGTPLRYLAHNCTDFLDAYSSGILGVRRREHITISGTASGHVFALTMRIAAHVLGQIPEKGLENVVERSVADWRKQREQRQEALMLCNPTAHRADWASRYFTERIDRDIERSLNRRRPKVGSA